MADPVIQLVMAERGGRLTLGPCILFMAVLRSLQTPSSLALRKQDPLYNNSVYNTRGPSKAGGPSHW